jgi:hypothetical protein
VRLPTALIAGSASTVTSAVATTSLLRDPLEGVRANPSTVDGLEGRSPVQVGLDSAADARCPDGSRVGR